jgi:hypothetical protein
MGTIVQLKHVRIAFIDDLFVPQQFEPGKGDYRHTCSFIVAPGSANDKAVQEAIQKEAVGAWAKKADAMLEDLRGDKKNYAYQKNKRGSNGEIYDGFEDMYALSGVRKQKDGAPLFLHNIKDEATGKAKRLNGTEGVIYAGCYVNAKVEMWAQSGAYRGIRCGILGVQFDAPGDSFGGASRPTDDGFDSVEAEDDLA